MPTEYFRFFFDVWFDTLQVMKERNDAGMTVHEGLLFNEVTIPDGEL